MAQSRPVRVSKFLAKHLRHDPGAIGLRLDKQGWARVDELLRCAARAGFPITKAELDDAVAEPVKRRYSYSENGQKVRAVQGHSVPVDLRYEPKTPPAVLYHGTHPGALSDIFRDGLAAMSRRHVHLSADVETARKVGARRGKPIILTVHAAQLATDGGIFYQADNGVWLTDQVPAEYLQLAEQ